jgi:mRNA interferase MazF
VVTPSAGTVVLVPFPFSDLSSSKLRPAVVLAEVSRNDWILCQITSNLYSDPQAVPITDSSFIQGSLHRISYARPGKLFTANRNLIVAQVGLLNKETLEKIIERTIELLRRSLESNAG